MNFRGDTIEHVLELIGRTTTPDRFNCIEIGCMFNENEGLFTYRIAKFIKERNLNSRFISIDYEFEHIDVARSLLYKYDNNLIDLVEFKNSNSLDILPSVLEEMEEVHFAFLDGGAHPEVCLKEFEIITKALCSSCVCLLDGNVELAPTIYYNSIRPFAKGTLIYPFLIVANYVKYKAGHPLKKEHESSIIHSLEKKIFEEFLGEMIFDLIRGRGGHIILIVRQKYNC